MSSDAFFLPEADGYRATEHATGPWSADLLHGGPPCALVTRAFERRFPDDFQLTRLSFELLRPVGFDLLHLAVEVEAEGANVRRGTAVLAAGGKPLIRATAVAFRREPLELAQAAEPPPPLLLEPPPFVFPFFPTPRGYHTSMELRFARGALGQSPVAVWLRMKLPLVPGEKPSPLVRTVCAADSGNGVAQVVDFRKYTFVNADMSLAFVRRPRGEWICLEAHTMATKDGIGLTDTRLWDEGGPIGRGSQGLLLRPRAR